MSGMYLIIGGNIGDRVNYLQKSIHFIEKEIGPIARKSFVYETASWGKTDQNAFLNQVLYVQTTYSAQQVLKICLDIEAKMGRTRDQKWDSRIIDIDILFYDHEIIHEDRLQIPHPFIQERRFVLVPLNEIAPMFKHPVLHKTVHLLLQECSDNLEVKKFN